MRLGMAEPTFVFWFYWGAEVRAFLFSGLIEEIARSARVVVLARKVPDGARSSGGTNTEFVEIPPLSAPRIHGWLTSLANKAHHAWLIQRRENLAVGDLAAIPKTTLGRKHAAKRVLGSVLGNANSVNLLNRLEDCIEKRGVKDVRQLLTNLVGNAVLISGDYLSVYGSVVVRRLVCDGNQAIFYPLNWRDVYKGVRLRRSFSSWMFWNQNMREVAVSFNPILQREHTLAVGALQFDSHFRSGWMRDRRDFIASLGLDANRPVVCYSAVAKNAYRGEAAIVASILEALETSQIGRGIQFLVRLNPAGSDPAYSSLQERFGERVMIYRPRLDKQPAAGPPWRAPSLEDAKVFANTIEHCALNIGLPSTVMLDFGVRGRNSICVAFDGDRSSKIGGARNFLEQPFFRQAQKRRVWPVANSPTDAAGLILRGVAEVECGRGLREYLSSIVGATDGRNHKRLASLLLSGVRQKGSTEHEW